MGGLLKMKLLYVGLKQFWGLLHILYDILGFLYCSVLKRFEKAKTKKIICRLQIFKRRYGQYKNINCVNVKEFK
jgi:hypothetical protein